MKDLLLVVLIVLVLFFAFLYVYKAKKKGVKCIGCPSASKCGKKSCVCSCSSDKENK
ncbi:MAG: FeoB-associated Cys-rich membrane protein [Ruminococcaceae bacterium]|nr:FeoB-associated Cys-rich membrane protein [Oscillospiraceae bacterium]